MKLPSHSTVAAYGALFIALGGTATAAATLGRDSVGAREVKRGAITTDELRDRGIRVRDLSRSARPPSRSRIAQIAQETMTTQEVLDALRGAVRGEPGPAGAPGAQGPQGASGVTGAVVREELSGAIGPDQAGGAFARCQPGERVIGGGGAEQAAGQSGVTLQSSYPITDSEQGWIVSYVNTGTQAETVRAFAVCAP